MTNIPDNHEGVRCSFRPAFPKGGRRGSGVAAYIVMRVKNANGTRVEGADPLATKLRVGEADFLDFPVSTQGGGRETVALIVADKERIDPAAIAASYREMRGAEHVEVKEFKAVVYAA